MPKQTHTQREKLNFTIFQNQIREATTSSKCEVKMYSLYEEQYIYDASEDVKEVITINIAFDVFWQVFYIRRKNFYLK